MKLTKKQQITVGVLIGVALVVAAYFMFFRPKPVVEQVDDDGTIPVASEKPIVADASDPNEVNARTGQPLRG